MSALEETRAAAVAARDTLDAAINQFATAINEAQNKAQQAAGLGLNGVVATVQSAQSLLETGSSSLGAAHQAADSAINIVGGITSETGAEEASYHLDAVIGQLDQAAACIDAAVSDTREAATRSQLAEIDQLSRVIIELEDTLSAARQSVGNGKERTQTYRWQVEALGN